MGRFRSVRQYWEGQSNIFVVRRIITKNVHFRRNIKCSLMRMGYNTMNVMRLGIDSLASARSHGFRCLYAGVSLRSTACLWSGAPCGAWQCHCTSYAGGSPPVRSQGFRCAPPPACGLLPLAGLGNTFVYRMQGFYRLLQGLRCTPPPVRSQGFSCASPPACGLLPLTGRNG